MSALESGKKIGIMLVICVLIVAGVAIWISLGFFNPVDVDAPPNPIVSSYASGYWDGEYIFSFLKVAPDPQARNLVTVEKTYLVVMDAEGEYSIWQDTPTATPFNYIHQVSEDKAFYLVHFTAGPVSMNPGEAYIWNFRTGEQRRILEGFDLQTHHAFKIGNRIFTAIRYIPDHPGGLDKIVEIDANTGEVIWEWSTESYFTEQPPGTPEKNWVVTNEVSLSLDGLYYYVNFRTINSMAKIDRENQTLKWILGEQGDFTLYENGVEKDTLWYGSHVIKEIEPNRFIMFDNDFYNKSHLETYPPWKDPLTSNYGGQSRLIEFIVDEENMTAEVVWSYRPASDYYSCQFGDFDILPNGNILGVFGMPLHNTTMTGQEIQEPFGATMLEINRAGTLIREYKWPPNYSIYRCQQVSQNPSDFVDLSWMLDL